MSLGSRTKRSEIYPSTRRTVEQIMIYPELPIFPLINSSSVTMLSAPSLSLRFHLRTSGDADADSMGRAGVGVVLSSRAEQALVEWIPVNSRLCATRLRTSINCSRTKNVERCLFIVSVYAPTDCSSDAAKDEFYDALEALLKRAKSSDIVMIAGDMNAQVE